MLSRLFRVLRGVRDGIRLRALVEAPADVQRAVDDDVAARLLPYLGQLPGAGMAGECDGLLAGLGGRGQEMGGQGDDGLQPQRLLGGLLVDAERVAVAELGPLLAVDAGVLRGPLLDGGPLGDVHDLTGSTAVVRHLGEAEEQHAAVGREREARHLVGQGCAVEGGE
ncbi:hypothetical protein AB0I51_36835 [Streptomyces sp. NPDC050549]|uniref:hypothetical protein n=1 Tax=Streptomyces sp. NPDC050549 TaxID=3155406 RepID=UPI0034222B70